MIFQRLHRCCRGATAIEYALIAAIISVAAISAMGSLGNSIGVSINNAANKMG